MRREALVLAGLAAIIFGRSGLFVTVQGQAAAASAQGNIVDPYTSFDMEVYDIIQKNFWQKPDDAAMAGLFTLAAQKVFADASLSASSTRDSVAAMLARGFAAATSTEARRADAELFAQVVLYNLPPNGRSGLLSQKQEQDLRNEVANKPAQDLYQTLGVSKDASTSTIDAAYQHKAAALAAATTSEAKQELATVQQAHEVLAKPAAKALYDETGMQPTVFMQPIGTHTIYIDMRQLSPASFGEFVQTLAQALRDVKRTAMIIDLRGNIGGSLDFAAYFLGLFLGPSSYAFDLFHQGAYEVQRTPPDIQKVVDLARFREIAILTDSMTQSTAELTTASMKRFHLARVVGTKTRGWGTVENTFPIESVIDPSTTYAVLLVHSLTLRDDNTPIEGAGVTPDVDSSQPGWQSKLADFFDSSELRAAIIGKIAQKTAQ